MGYRNKTNLNWMRGTQVRKVRDHIRCEVVMTKGRIQHVEVGRRFSSEIKMLKRILQKIQLNGKKFLADRLYEWLREYLEGRGIKTLIRVRKDAVGREDVSVDEYKERNEIEGLFGVIKGKLGGYVMVCREDMAMVLALVKFLAHSMYVALFLRILSCLSCLFPPDPSIITRLSSGFLKQPPS